MDALEAARMFTEFYSLEHPALDVRQNLDYQAAGLLRLGPHRVGKPEWFEAAQVWENTSDEKKFEVAKRLLIESLDKPRNT